MNRLWILLAGIIFAPLIVWGAIYFLPCLDNPRRLSGTALFVIGVGALSLAALQPSAPRIVFGCILTLVGASFLVNDVAFASVIDRLTLAWIRATDWLSNCADGNIPATVPGTTGLFLLIANLLLLAKKCAWQAWVGVNLGLILAAQWLNRVN